MAFVLVQHLASDRKSILSDLVKRYTRLQVFDVEEAPSPRHRAGGRDWVSDRRQTCQLRMGARGLRSS